MSRHVQRQRPAAESDLAGRPRLRAEVEAITPQEKTESDSNGRRPAGAKRDEPLVMFGQRVPVSLQRKVKIAAVHRGIELQEAAVEAWRAWLTMQSEASKRESG